MSTTIDVITTGASIVGALGVLLWAIYVYYQLRRERTASERQARAIAHLEAQNKKLNDIAFKVRNLELTHCADPDVTANPQLAALLQCPQPASTAPAGGPNVGALPAAYVTHGGAPVQMGDAGRTRPTHMSPPAMGMPAFY